MPVVVPLEAVEEGELDAPITLIDTRTGDDFMEETSREQQRLFITIINNIIVISSSNKDSK